MALKSTKAHCLTKRLKMIAVFDVLPFVHEAQEALWTAFVVWRIGLRDVYFVRSSNYPQTD